MRQPDCRVTSRVVFRPNSTGPFCMDRVARLNHALRVLERRACCGSRHVVVVQHRVPTA